PWHRRAAEWLGYRLVLPRHWLLLALSWLLAVAQWGRLVPAPLPLPRLSFRSLPPPPRAGHPPGPPRPYPLPAGPPAPRPAGPPGHGRGRRAPGTARPRRRLLWCVARARRTRRRGAAPRSPRHRVHAGRRAGGRRQRGMRRRHEGLRTSARNNRGGHVRGAG